MEKTLRVEKRRLVFNFASETDFTKEKNTKKCVLESKVCCVCVLFCWVSVVIHFCTMEIRNHLGLLSLSLGS